MAVPAFRRCSFIGSVVILSACLPTPPKASTPTCTNSASSRPGPPPRWASRAGTSVNSTSTSACINRACATPKRSGPTKPSNSRGSARGRPSSSGTPPTPSGSSAANSTPATTASTATSRPVTATKPPSSGKASRSSEPPTAAGGPHPAHPRPRSSTSRIANSRSTPRAAPARSNPWASKRATSSPSTCP